MASTPPSSIMLNWHSQYLTPPQNFKTLQHRDESLCTASKALPPRLIDIDPLLLSTLELEVMVNVPINTFPRQYLMQLADLAARHFIVTGRYPGFGARFDLLNGHDGRVIGASYQFECCVCSSCSRWRDVHDNSRVGCSFPSKMRRY